MGNDRWLVPAASCCGLAVLAGLVSGLYLWAAFWCAVGCGTLIMWMDSCWLELLDGPRVIVAVEPVEELEVAA